MSATKKRIVIVGMLQRQFEVVRRRIGNKAELQLVSSDGGMGKAMQLMHSGAYLVVNTKWVSHSHMAHADRSRTRLCCGGDTTITRAVEELIAS